jgi:nucleoside-diphosphate-sugar epimerase
VILLTGANGHLGANLVRRLLGEGEEIRVFLRPQSDNRSVQGLPVEQVYGDLRQKETVNAAVRDCTQIYHVAAKVSTLNCQHRELYECNVIGTRNLLQAAINAGVSKVVVSGSLSAVGHDPDRPCDENVPFHPFQRQLPYSITKCFVEHECLKAAVEGLQVVTAVSCAILGPWDFKPSRMGKLLLDFSNGRLAAYIPGGCEFVSARDIVEGHLLAMRHGRSGQKYIFTTQFLTVDQLMGIFEQVTGRRRPRLRIPGLLMERLAAVLSPAMTFLRPGSLQRFTPAAVRILRMQRRASCAKARHELGYESTSIVDAIQSAYDWFAERGLISRPTLEAGGKHMNLAGS